MTWYSGGTIAVTNGNAEVVGTALSFTTAGIKKGDALVIGTSRVEIADVVDATHLILTQVWGGTTDGTAQYHIEPIGQSHYNVGTLIEQTKDYIDLFKLQNKNAVLSRSLTTPPTSPLVGNRYIVASGATGLWQDQDDNYAKWMGNKWRFDRPGDVFGGIFCWDEAAQEMLVYSVTGWTVLEGALVGPQGDQGIQGVQGVQGLAGPATPYGLITTPTISTNTIFIDEVNGSDTNDGKSVGGAVKSILKLLTLLAAGQRNLVWCLSDITFNYFVKSNLNDFYISFYGRSSDHTSNVRRKITVTDATNNTSYPGCFLFKGIGIVYLYQMDIELNTSRNYPMFQFTGIGHFSAYFCNVTRVGSGSAKVIGHSLCWVGAYFAASTIDASAQGYIFNGVASGANPNNSWQFNTNLTSA